jgi:hypothetical protein
MAVPMELERFVAVVTLQWAVSGIVTGTIFALSLWYIGRRTGSLGALSRRRAAAWGALAGVALPLGFGALLTAGGIGVPLAALLPLVATGAAFGAGTAAGMITLARRAPEPLAARRGAPALSPPVA